MTHHDFRYPDTFVIVNGYRMHYYHSGTESPLNVVMLHGSGSSAYAYRGFFPHLVGAGFRCFAPDFIGFGQSDKPEDAAVHTFDFHSDSLQSFVRELELRNLILVGHEWGGLVALDYAINRPENTLGLALTDSGVFLPDRSSGIRGLLHRSVLGSLLVRRFNLGRGHNRGQGDDGGRDGGSQSELQSGATRLGFLRMLAHVNVGYNAIRMRAIRNSLRGLETPTLLIRSGESQMFTEAEFRFLEKHLPYVGARTIPGTGLLHEDHSEVAASWIMGFLSPLTARLAGSSATSFRVTS